MTKQKFPKTMFVKIGDGGTGPDYFVADEGLNGMVEVGETEKIAVYKLSHVEDVEGLVRVKPRRGN